MCAAAKGFSLHIGLNYVDPIHYQGWDGTLHGCINDATDMEVLANSAGYVTSRLIDGEATREAVATRIRAAADGLRDGDIFMVSYSGHGSQVPNVPGGDREEDGYDETWCLYDGQMVDDEFTLLWRQFAPGVRILLISDSCHSETIARVAPPFSVASAAPPRLARLMPLAVQRRIYLTQRERFQEMQVRAKSALDRAPELRCTVRTLSGCRDYELSYDGTENGEFTGALLATWDFGRFRGDYRAFHQAIVPRITTPQNPQHSVIGRPNAEFDAQTPFAIGGATRRTGLASAARLVREVPDDWQRAELAIERYVRDRHPSQIREWRSVTPGTSWGILAGPWIDAAGTMIDYYNELNPQGSQIDGTAREVRNAIGNLRSRPLAELHEFMFNWATGEEPRAELGGTGRAQAGDGE